MKKTILALALIVPLTACTDSDGAIEAVEAMGMTEVEATGYSYWGCSEDDWFHTTFKAKSSNGKEVSGVVCKGLFKGSTVRLD